MDELIKCMQECELNDKTKQKLIKDINCIIDQIAFYINIEFPVDNYYEPEEIPKVKKALVFSYPHTSYWDGFYTILTSYFLNGYIIFKSDDNGWVNTVAYLLGQPTVDRKQSCNQTQIISDLIRYGEVRRGWLGFSIDRQSLIRQRKLVISEVVDGGPAHSAGLMKNDILISINSNIPSYENLFKTFARSKPGQKIYFEVERNQQNIDISIIAGEVD